MPGRAQRPISRTIEPPLPIRICFWLSRLGVEADVHAALVDLDELGGERVRHLLAGQPQRLLAHELARSAPRAACRSPRPAGTGTGPPAAARRGRRGAPSIPSPVFALTGWSAWKSPSSSRRLHLLGDVSRLEPVDLVDHDHDRDAEREDVPRDVAVAGADPLARVDHEQRHVEIVGDRLARRAPACARSARRSAAASPAGRRARAGRRPASRRRGYGGASCGAPARRSRPSRRRAR